MGSARFFLTFLFFFLPFFSEGVSPTSFCSSEWGTFPTRQNGRVKPLFVHARESIKYLTGKAQFRGMDSTVFYCRLSLFPEKKAFQEEGDTAFKEEFEQGRKNWSKGQEDFYLEIISGQNWTIPSEDDKGKLSWIPIKSLLEKFEIKTNDLEKNYPKLRQLLSSVSSNFQHQEGKIHILEYYFVIFKPPLWAMILTLLALVALTFFRRFKEALYLTGLTLVIQAVVIVLRVIISGRAPVTNMYETVLFSGFMALLLALLLGHFKKEKAFLYVGLIYNACTLIMMNFATGMLSDSINPLVPVLRDDFWLSTHVTTVVMSYSAFALSWVLANIILIRKRFSSLPKASEAHYSHLIYLCLKYGTILLGAGVILGGIWADYSWGRFWGWDPKETASLIAFCCYMAILHGRHTNWISPHRFLVFTALAFLSIMMAWFGVNYVLAEGFHSYGFSEGGSLFLLSFTLAQVAILLVAGKENKFHALKKGPI